MLKINSEKKILVCDMSSVPDVVWDDLLTHMLTSPTSETRLLDTYTIDMFAVSSDSSIDPETVRWCQTILTQIEGFEFILFK